MRCPRGWVLTPAFVDAAFADPNTATDENSSRPRPGWKLGGYWRKKACISVLSPTPTQPITSRKLDSNHLREDVGKVRSDHGSVGPRRGAHGGRELFQVAVSAAATNLRCDRTSVDAGGNPCN